MIARILLALAMLLIPAQLLANDLEGHWAFRVDDANIFIFGISQDDGEWRGDWQRPDTFRTNGAVFSDMVGSDRLETSAAREVDGAIDLAFDDGGERPTVFRFRHVGENRAELVYVGTPLAPFPLVRVGSDAQVGPFDAARLYDRDNAVTQMDYSPEAEPEPAAPAAPAEEPSPEPAATGLSDDFLDGVGTQTTPPPATPVAPSAVIRACTDFDRADPPALAELEARWGDEYESVGNGLDIRDYRMANGDTARITLLDDRVYINSCGPD